MPLNKFYEACCDDCGALEQLPSEKLRDARAWLKERGWILLKDELLCALCFEKRLAAARKAAKESERS